MTADISNDVAIWGGGILRMTLAREASGYYKAQNIASRFGMCERLKYRLTANSISC